uniref:Radical SAM domain protein n=1 Tax=Cyanothece sp. (strain PCC 7425 / ATCC 29141) TaxID=395961 RepID=B8HSF7_CYAP4
MVADPKAFEQTVPEMTGEHTPYSPRNHRRILCVFPRYSRSFGTFHHAYSLMGRDVRAFMPPQGILLVAAYMPASWEVRLVDENVTPATEADYRWADVVITSGMHIQRPQINQINEIAHRLGKLTVVGGPSVSGCPEYYPDFDILHLGELGDATDRMIEYFDLHGSTRPPAQLRFETLERLPLSQFPVPAYNLVNVRNYFLGSVQFSSGCPFRCEFCDIPELYGRNPRLKTPEQILQELDTMLASGNPGAVYFVDDNFIGNRRAVTELLPHLIDWQKRNGYPIQFACEATLNIAQSPKLLEMMREAYFCTVFCGIETPEPDALHAISKDQNLSMPILEAIKTLNRYGMEVVSGIIIGLDTDTPQTGDRILDFIRASQIPTLTINLLHALPRTPLWRRLEAEGRLNYDENRESNVEFLMPYEEVVEMWRRTITTAYEPEFLYQRFDYQCQNTFPNRIKPPNSPARVSRENVNKGLRALRNIIWQVGVLSDYRRTFWKYNWPRLKAGKIESVISTSLVSHHLIKFAQECGRGDEAAAFYAQRVEQKPEGLQLVSPRS